MKNEGAIGKSAEDYLESMIILKEKNGYIRSIDIATFLGVTKPSVSNAMKRLREEGYIEMNRSGFITVTEKGMEIADKIYTRHKKLTDFFIALGVTAEVAEDDACKIEHDLSDETFEAICVHVDKFSKANKSKKK
ncbi:MAG: metal-dependent transcriptional regulator [Clostridiales bacterium]|jgi:Mn-dependent DtxR family transcriptional regulator|nr:metal-dependent transcriptional regulator [Clostridiales bacterium]MBQ1744993.1 metal-dependent transcriptional regulator [Clostridiales bacterium]MBQ5520246.1 metal-dependent transcriptional regulator [Clostridiales bacterium]